MSTALSPVDAAGAAGASLEQAEPEPLANEAELLGLLGDLLADDEAREHVLRELRTAQVELRAVFASYSIDRTPVEADSGAIVAESADVGRGLPLPAWHQLCADTGVDGLPEVEDAFLAFAPLEDPSPCLAEPQFFAALVRLASSLTDEAQGLARSLYTLLYECVLPFARDTSAVFSRVLGSRSYLLPYLEEIRGSFSGFGVTWEQWLKSGLSCGWPACLVIPTGSARSSARCRRIWACCCVCSASTLR